jgi:hypothetical protein
MIIEHLFFVKGQYQKIGAFLKSVFQPYPKNGVYQASSRLVNTIFWEISLPLYWKAPPEAERLDMVGLGEHVYGSGLLELVAAFQQAPGIPGQGSRIARDIG